MSLEKRLIAAVIAVLVATLGLGATLTYHLVDAKVQTEMKAALTVGVRTAQSVLTAERGNADPRTRLASLIATFNGDRHLRATLRGPGNAVLQQSELEPPLSPAPGFLLAFARGKDRSAAIPLPRDLAAAGTLRLETDNRNEVAEAWESTRLALAILGLFFVMNLALILWITRGARRPLRELCDALARVGAGDYAARLSWRRRPDLDPVQGGFNRMAARLWDMERQNRALHARIENAQEDERAALARDLHDDVAPFLFAVSADAALIQALAQCGQQPELVSRAQSMQGAIGHMQRHLRDILARLLPDAVLDRGLSAAVEALVEFWKTQKPHIDFSWDVTEVDLGQTQRIAIFRIVQESLSNAIRHGDPTRIAIAVAAQDGNVTVRVIDDGSGLPATATVTGFGLRGMKERVAKLGGRLSIANAPAGGVEVHAIFAGVTPAVAAQ
jgi:two-component system sensor histidine kinase UhpB